LGRMTGSQRHGWAVWSAMAVLFLAGVLVAYWSEARGNPLLAGTDQAVSAMQPGGNMEARRVASGFATARSFRRVRMMLRVARLMACTIRLLLSVAWSRWQTSC